MDSEKEQKKAEISDVIEKFGKYQISQYILICISSTCITMITLNYIFVVGDLRYRCRVSECDDGNSTVEFPRWWPNTSIDRCHRPVLRGGEQTCTNESFTGEVVPCDKWIYESNKTVIAEFDLACQPFKSNLIGSVHGLGMLVSMAGLGCLADKFGRKPMLIICIVAGVIGHLKAFAPSYYMYISIEFIEATVTGGNYSAAMVLIMEISNKKYRMWAGVLFSCALHAGECIYSLITWIVPHWKTVIRILNTPSIFFISYIFLVNESLRWQIINGKFENAKKTIKKIAKVNKLNINQEELDNIDENTLKEKFNIQRNEIKENFANIFKSREIMKRVIILSIARFAARLVYHGLTLNSVWLPGDKYLNFFISGISSLPGEFLALYLMAKVGRKIPLILGYSLCGILSVVSALTPERYLWVKLSFFFLSKMLVSSCYSATLTYTMELYPTSVRGTLLGIGAFVARSAGMFSALTPILITISPEIPFIFFGITAIFASLLLTMTPETRDLPLYDTIKQVEDSVQNYGIVNKQNITITAIDGNMKTRL